MIIRTARVIQREKRRQDALRALELIDQGKTASQAATELGTSRTRLYSEWKRIAKQAAEGIDELLL